MSEHARVFFFLLSFHAERLLPKLTDTLILQTEHCNVSICDLLYKLFIFSGLDFGLQLIGSEIYQLAKLHCTAR